MTDADTIIARCTRNGAVLWHHVAKQLGTSVDRARSQYDPAYRTARPRSEELADEEAA